MYFFKAIDGNNLDMESDENKENQEQDDKIGIDKFNTGMLI